MYSSFKSLVVTVCTVAVVAVVPLAVDLRIAEDSADAVAVKANTAVTLGGNGTPEQKIDGVSRPAGAMIVGIEPAAASPTETPDDVSAVGAEAPGSIGAALVPATTIGAPTPSPAVPPSVPMTPTGPFLVPTAATQVAAQPGAEATDAVTVEGSALIEGGLGSDMGGDLPPEALPAPPHPECPITAAGPWWTDPADPYTCIPPDSIPFHEPVPPGIPPELLEPIVDDAEVPADSVGWYEPTPPGIDPALLEPVFEDVEQVAAGE